MPSMASVLGRRGQKKLRVQERHRYTKDNMENGQKLGLCLHVNQNQQGWSDVARAKKGSTSLESFGGNMTLQTA